ncbi:hypothetical protein SAMN03159353_10505 [Cedecea sp. NFIX57]|jgi:hypothetical protein|nr:hypothetical protein SAMN03159353_10505 [Cedecea sp. NFIX57]
MVREKRISKGQIQNPDKSANELQSGWPREGRMDPTYSAPAGMNVILSDIPGIHYTEHIPNS